MFGIDILVKLFKILRSNATPGQIAGGFILGMVIGLTPFLSLHNLVVLLLIIVLNVNIGSALFGFAIFSLFAYLLDPLFHSFGYFLLVDLTFMKSVYTTLYNMPLVSLSRFYNTVVMGSLVFSILAMLPAYFATARFVVVYREKLDPKFQKLKIVQAVKASKLGVTISKIYSWRQ